MVQGNEPEMVSRLGRPEGKIATLSRLSAEAAVFLVASANPWLLTNLRATTTAAQQGLSHQATCNVSLGSSEREPPGFEPSRASPVTC